MKRLLTLALFVTSGCHGDNDLGLGSGGSGLLWSRQPSHLTSTLIAVGPAIGLGSADLYAEGDGTPPNQSILRYDGTAWSTARPVFMSCLTCKTPRTVSVAGLTLNADAGGSVLRLDAAKGWVSEKTGLSRDVLALWASDPTHVFAVADGGGIALFDGNAWRVTPSPTARTLRAVFGSSAIDVFAVGDMGTIVHWDGTAWSLDEVITYDTLRDVWGSSPLGFFVVGDNGVILHRAKF